MKPNRFAVYYKSTATSSYPFYFWKLLTLCDDRATAQRWVDSYEHNSYELQICAGDDSPCVPELLVEDILDELWLDNDIQLGHIWRA